MKKFILPLIFCIAVCDVQSQDKEKKAENLVPNNSFENFEGNLRRDGEFDVSKEWASGTLAPADLYSSTVKSKYVQVPKNLNGTQEPFEGNGYAGINLYSYRSKEPRTYVSVKLTSSLKENGLYCVKYRASLADLSKYASNNLSAVISKKNPTEKSSVSIIRKDYIIPAKNNVITDRDGWSEFCKLFNAKGGEQYLIIGNFQTDDRTRTEEMSALPQSEEEQINMAYYYIDAVVVEEVEYSEDCNCESSAIPESKIIFSGNVAITEEMSISEKVEAVSVYFYQYNDDVVSAAERNSDKIVELMEMSPGMRIEIVGHSDVEETALAVKESSLNNLAKKRAEAVKNYIVSKGINASRISVSSKDDSEPVSNMKTPISLAKNRRVEFKAVF